MQITSLWFHHKGKTYSRDQIAEIEPEYFDASCMVKVQDPMPEIVASEPKLLEEKTECLEECGALESSVPNLN